MAADITICKVCQNLEIDAPHRQIYDYAYLVASVDKITKRVSEGCRFCQILLDVVKKSKDYKFPIEEDSIQVQSNKIGATLVVSGASYYQHKDEFQLYRIEGPQKSGSTVGIARPIGEGYGLSDQNLDLAKDWFSTCLSHHSKCQTISHSGLPTRVICIGTSTQQPYLYISKGENVPYAALSYCWGGQVPLQTTIATLAARKEGILYDELPKLFQNVFQVLRYFEITYVWIDALCIIQDSPEDWTREASRMQEVYGGATLTIAADVANNPNEGLESKLRDDARSFRAGPNDASGDGFYMRDFGHCFDALQATHVPRSRGYTRQVLDSRGWTLQERILSARILHFGSYEMSWECDAVKWCECTVGQMKYQGDEEHEYMELSATRYHKEARMLSKQDRSQVHGFAYWRELVEEYTARSLSFPSDRLPAISGLAARFEAGLPDATYITGLWKEDPVSLAWYVAFGTYKKSASRIERCLSWSWASIDGPISFQQYSPEENHVEIVSWNKEKGLLEIRGPILKFDSKSIAEEKSDVRILPQRLEDLKSDIDVPWVEGEEYYLLAVVTHKEGTPCLVLQAVENRPGVYVRVGYYNAHTYTSKSPLWDEVFKNTTIELL